MPCGKVDGLLEKTSESPIYSALERSANVTPETTRVSH